MKFTVKTRITAPLSTVFTAWLDCEGHTKMTGGEAIVSVDVGASFSAWDGYIWGENLEIELNKRILQTWRTTDFSDDDEDSVLEIRFSEIDGVTEITLVHSNLPAHGEQYKQGWEDHYFTPMKKYFE